MADGFTLDLEYPQNDIAVIRFADPGRQNQLCWAAVCRLAELLEQCEQEGARVVILSSDLPGHWFEHAWLGDLAAGMAGEETTGDGAGWFRVVRRLSRSRLVSIAAINGNTCGGGCEIGWSCDLRVAERQACFSQPEVRVGLIPGMGGVSRLNALAGRTVASEMVLCGGWMNAERLYQVGAVNRVVETGQSLDHALEWARELVSLPAAALANCKHCLAEIQELPLQQALEREQELFQASAGDAIDIMREQQQYYDAGGSTLASFGKPVSE